MSAIPRLFSARGIVPRAESFLGATGRAGILVSSGRIVSLHDGAKAVERVAQRTGAHRTDLGQVVLLPGLVNAHAHLELTGLKGLVPPGEDFPDWVAGLLRERGRRSGDVLCADAGEGLQRALATGTTTIGDIASSGATLAARSSRGPRLRLYREVLDAWDESRASAAIAALAPRLREGARLWEGYSPHAPYTVSGKLMAALAKLCKKRPRPVAMHWAEMDAEIEWMQSGTGPFAPVLGRSPKRSGLALLEEAGLLGAETALIHGNLPARGEIARVAAAGASIVHCPGTHRFFDRDDFPLAQYRRAAVNVALGTDSLASNEDLDLLREARLLGIREPDLSPDELLYMITGAGARALGLAGEVGHLEPGARADFITCKASNSDLQRRGGREALERLFREPGGGMGPSNKKLIRSTWIGGCSAQVVVS